MIVSISRRTDIPAFYTPWLLGRLEEGYALVRNPMNHHRVSRVSLRPDVVDAMVLWTKNPLPLIPHLRALDVLPYYIQFTLTPYDSEIEPALPEKQELIEAFRFLAAHLGSDHLVWRYDPILFSSRYTSEVHVRVFSQMAQRLEGCTDTCVVSFLDAYRCCAPALRQHGLVAPTPDQIFPLMQSFSEIARQHGLALRTCCEEVNLSVLNILPSRCIDPVRLERIVHKRLNLKPDRNQRASCGCAASVDIGAYDTCPGGCLYCYARHSLSTLQRNQGLHDPTSPLLLGHLEPDDVVTDRTQFSCRTKD